MNKVVYILLALANLACITLILIGFRLDYPFMIVFEIVCFGIIYSEFRKGKSAHGTIAIQKRPDNSRGIQLILDETPEDLEKKSKVIFTVKTSTQKKHSI